jgi:hypothetical protein
LFCVFLYVIYEAYLDVVSIPGNGNYFPTPDTYSDYVKEDKEQNIKIKDAKQKNYL